MRFHSLFYQHNYTKTKLFQLKVTSIQTYSFLYYAKFLINWHQLHARLIEIVNICTRQDNITLIK